MGFGNPGQRCECCINWVEKDKLKRKRGKCGFFDLHMFRTDCCLLFRPTEETVNELNSRRLMLDRIALNLRVKRKMLNMFEDPGMYPLIGKSIEKMISMKLEWERDTMRINESRTEDKIIAELEGKIKIYMEEHFKHLFK